MKIAVLFPKDSIGFFDKNSNITFGGATVQLHNICSELNIQGVDLTALIPDHYLISDKSIISYNAIEIYKSRTILPIKFISMIKYLTKLKPDFVFQRGISPLSLPFILLLKILRIKSVFMFAHDIETKGFYQNSRKTFKHFNKLLKYSSILVCQNESQKRNINSKYHSKIIIFKKGVEIPTGVRMHHSDRKYDAIWIARCEKWKNPEIFINLARQNPENKFSMVCSISPGNDKYFNEIKTNASRCSNLEFHEYMNNKKIQKLYQNSKIFCLTSDSEGDWPMTVLESISMQTPILSLHINIEDSLNKYKFGIFCDNNIEIFNKNFKNIITNENSLLNLKENTLKYINKFHNIKKNVTMLTKAINKH